MNRLITWIKVAKAVMLVSTPLLLGAADTAAPQGMAVPGAAQALDSLKAGNARFVANASTHPRDDAAHLLWQAEGQAPLATILTCSDSRVPVELVFDQGFGDLFIIRVAGNVSDTDEIGTAEYGTKYLGTPLLIVMGHSACGAVKAVCTGASVGGSIPKLVDNIVPAVERAGAETGLTGEALLGAATTENVWQSIDDLISGSNTIAELINSGKLEVQGAVYDIASGKVEWLGAHPEQAALVSAALAARPAARNSSSAEG